MDLISFFKATSLLQEGHEPNERGPQEGHEDDQGTGAPQLYGQAGIVQHTFLTHYIRKLFYRAKNGLKTQSQANNLGEELPFILHVLFRGRTLCPRLCTSSPIPVVSEEKYSC